MIFFDSRRSLILLLVCNWTLLSFNLFAQHKRLDLVLATPNKEIFGTNGSKFYMYTDRTFEGKPSKPWEGGKYGYVRNPKRTSSGILYSKFHEGIDIKPISRDSRGVPLDKIRSISLLNDIEERSLQNYLQLQNHLILVRILVQFLVFANSVIIILIQFVTAE